MARLRRPAASRIRKAMRRSTSISSSISATAQTIRYSDARRFGLMDLVPADGLASYATVQGPRGRAARLELHAGMARRKAQGQGDLDQGGADRSEADRGDRQHLCLRGAIPRRHLAAEARRLACHQNRQADGEKTKALVAGIKAVLEDAIQAGGSSLRDYKRADGSLGEFQHRFKVYGREGKPCAKKRLRRNRTPHRPGRTVDFLLSNLSTLGDLCHMFECLHHPGAAGCAERRTAPMTPSSSRPRARSGSSRSTARMR